MESFAFQLNCLFIITDRSNVHITADKVLICQSISGSILHSLVNKIPINCTWTVLLQAEALLNQREQSTFFQQRIVASDLKDLTPVLAISHSTENCHCTHWRSWPEDANKISSAKVPEVPKLDTFQSMIVSWDATNRIGDKRHIWQCPTHKDADSAFALLIQGLDSP